MTPTRRQLLRLEVPFAVLGSALIACAFLFSLTGIPSWIPPAPIVRLGIPSPLSGMTRSFVALASGDVSSAVAWHPLGPVVFAVCVALPVVAAVAWVRDRRFVSLTRIASARTTWAIALLSVAAVWVRQVAVLG